VPGVAGGVSSRKLEAGQSPIQYPDLLSASTTLVQSGSGYLRLVNALQTLDQAANVLTLDGLITSQASAIATLQSQMAQTITAVQTLQTQVFTLQSQVAALQAQLDGVSFGAVGPTVPSIAAGSIATTISGTQYLLPLYSS